MPTVARFGNLRAVVYPNDHRPAHVHIQGRGHEAIFVLNCPDGPSEIRANYGFGLRELNDVLSWIQQSIVPICEAWRQFHGPD